MYCNIFILYIQMYYSYPYIFLHGILAVLSCLDLSSVFSLITFLLTPENSSLMVRHQQNVYILKASSEITFILLNPNLDIPWGKPFHVAALFFAPK